MPTLNWIGKEAVVNHHHQVPFHLLKDVPDLACGEPGDGNLIVQGDNLVALKALLPYYAGQVKCIYIDPPYNTGNEGWAYNDNVNSPLIREWLGKAVGKEAEDLSRHDKWLCMMYPRLLLLRQFLREDGIIFVSLDDTEASFCRVLMDEIFGAANCLAIVAWEKRYTRSNNAKMFYSMKDTVLVYRRSIAVNFLREARTEKSNSIYKNPDDDPRGSWTSASYVNPATKEQRPNLVYQIQNPFNGKEVNHPTHAWKFEVDEHRRHVEENRLWWGKSGNAKYPRLKIFPKEENAGLVPVDIWNHEDSGTTDEGGGELKAIFGAAVFENPKPTKLLHRIFQLATGPNDLILDSFAGSGTTGHAVLSLNKQDGGNRHFILVEMEPKISREVTAERVRRVAEGYKNAKGEEVNGLGGSFRYCELGEPLFDESGKIRGTVSFADLARHVYFTETGEPLPRERVTKSPFIGECRGVGIYLLFNGILGDKRVQGGNVLTRSVLAKLPKFDGQKVIYCAGCLLGKDRLQAERILVRQTPYEIKVS
jgi:site-specific DNA-methyltransferase (adenine-specific)/adenine-specific DNA-methyltransferase